VKFNAKVNKLFEPIIRKDWDEDGGVNKDKSSGSSSSSSSDSSSGSPSSKDDKKQKIP
jgi:hypothetical protein